MAVEIIELSTPSHYKAFVELQFGIYKGNDYWVPPIKKDEIKAIQAATNPAFEFCKAKFWLAKKNGKVVGRIGAIINELYIEKTGEKLGRFTRTEFYDDKEVTAALFATAEKWLKEQGMEKVQGPLGFTNLDHQGMLVEGFDELPSAASEYHHAYYQEHMVLNGYKKEIDWIEFRIKLEGIPEKAKRVSEIVKKRNGFKVVSFTSMKEVVPHAKNLFYVLNKAFEDLFSVVPLNEKMVEYYTNRYLMLLNPKFIKLIYSKDDELAGFIIGLPSLSKGLQKAKGKLFPFGWYHIKQALEKPKLIDLMLTGVLPEYHGKGLLAIVINELQTVMEANNVFEVETTGVFETNSKVIQGWKIYNHRQHKRKRCWIKTL